MEPYIFEIGVGVIGTLCAAIGHLWRAQVGQHKAVSAKLERSEDNQRETLKEIGSIKERLGVEIGRNEAMEEAHRDVIDTVAKAIIERNTRS